MSESKLSNGDRLLQFLLFAALTAFCCFYSTTALSAPTQNEIEAVQQLNRQSETLWNQGELKEAIATAIQALTLAEDSLGPEHPDTATSLNNLGLYYSDAGDYARAEPLLQRALNIRERVYGTEHSNTATSLNNLGVYYYNLANYAQAEPLFLRTLKIWEKTLGLEHPNTATSLNNLGGLYFAMGDYTQAETLYQRALKIREKTLGLEHPNTAANLNSLGELYWKTGDYARAEPLYQRALETREKILGREHPATTTSLNNLGLLYYTMGDFPRAEPLYQRALETREKILGREHPATATSLNNLGMLYTDVGDYGQAEPLFQRALEIREKALGREHPNTATSLNNLGGLYFAMGDYTQAETLYQRALKIREKTLGLEHPNTAANLNSLGELYWKTGDYARAEPLYQRALETREKILGLEHPATATSLNNLGVLYEYMGDYARAVKFHKRALKIREKVLDPEHTSTAMSLHNLGALYWKTGDYALAEPLFQRALNIREKALGFEHPDTAMTLNNLGQLYYNMGDYAQAEKFQKRALKIWEQALGPEHPDIATSLNNLGLLYWGMGNYARAEPLYQRALKIRENSLGSEHPDTGLSLSNLGYLMFDSGKKRKAKRLAARKQEAETAALANVLSFTSERQRLAYQQTLNPYSLYAVLEDAPGLTTAILRFKGVVLDSMVEDRRIAEGSHDPEYQAVLAELRSVKQRLAKLLLEVPSDTSAAARERRETQQRELTTQLEQLEARLARHVAGIGQTRRALGVKVKEVQAALPKHTALVELLRYRHYLGKNQWETRYGAALLERRGKPRWVSLGKAEDIDAHIKRYQAAVRTRTPDQTLSTLLSALYQQVWVPIGEVLPEDTETVLISPDGQLNFLSFATLLTPEDQFLAERYALRYLASGRDLLQQPASASTKRMELYANPNFAGKGATPSRGGDESLVLAEADRRDFQRVQFVPLPGTARERATLEARARDWRWSVTAYEGDKASEAQLAQTRDPWVLHLATHGFFLPETAPTGMRPAMGMQSGGLSAIPVVLQNPMHRSGLALTGAQATLEAWKRGEVPATKNDGILTAEEVGALDLAGTWLAVLSACDTGMGEARSGEGVLGLRRGFVQAGVQNLLMTLWPVADRETADFMVDFYTAAHASGNAPQALAEVQREWLSRLRSERGLSMAVRLAGPFILSAQGAVL